MRTLARVELLIRLAYRNANPFEGAAAWRKAQELMASAGISANALSADVRRMHSELSGKTGDILYTRICAMCATAFSTSNPLAQWCSSLCELEWVMRRRAHDSKRGVRRTHTVNQSGLVRKVEDKEWSNQVCHRCGETYEYMTYPGNPRRYCETCRIYVRRAADRARKQAARLAARAQDQ